MTIPEGKITALIGSSGAGKTTSARLIAGFWNNYEGDIKIGGKSIRSMSQEELYGNIAFVFQENLILSDTDCNSLLFSSRKVVPTITNHCLILIRKRHNKVMYLCFLRSNYNIIHCSCCIVHSNVSFNSIR